jgi:hypothetical protein
MAMQAQLYRGTVRLKVNLNGALVFPSGDAASLLRSRLVARSIAITLALSVGIYMPNGFIEDPPRNSCQNLSKTLVYSPSYEIPTSRIFLPSLIFVLHVFLVKIKTLCIVVDLFINPIYSHNYCLAILDF